MTRFGVQGSGQLVGGAPDPAFFRDVARLAEDAGFDSLWAGDHISFENPLLDVTVALSAFAAWTERIQLGAGVVLLPLRSPAVVAKEWTASAKRRPYAENVAAARGMISLRIPNCWHTSARKSPEAPP